MDKYIKQLLLEFSKIILPDFGAITISDEETGELMFQEFLQYDDGKLAALLEAESTMSLQEAKNAVAKFIRELKYHLDKGETYAIYQLGEFTKSENDEYVFHGNIKTGMVTKPTEEDSDSTKKSPSLGAVLSQVAEEKPEPEEKPEEEPEEEEKVESVKKATPPPVEKKEETPTKKRNIYIPKVEQTEAEADIDANPPTEKEVVLVSDEKPTEEKKKKRGAFFWLISILLLFILVTGIIMALNYNKVEEYLGWNKFKEAQNFPEENEKEGDELQLNEEPTEIQAADEDEGTNESETQGETETVADSQSDDALTDSEIDDAIIESITEKVAETPANTENKYHAISGTFEELTNAENMVQSLKEKGLDAKVIGPFNGMQYVSSQSYPTRQEAQADIQRIRKISGGAWIYKSK